MERNAPSFVLKAVEALHSDGCEQGQFCEGCEHWHSAIRIAEILEPIAHDYGQRQRFLASIVSDIGRCLHDGRVALYYGVKHRRMAYGGSAKVVAALAALAGLGVTILIVRQLFELAAFLAEKFATALEVLPISPFSSICCALLLLWLIWPFVLRLMNFTSMLAFSVILIVALGASIAALLLQGFQIIAIFAIPYLALRRLAHLWFGV